MYKIVSLSTFLLAMLVFTLSGCNSGTQESTTPIDDSQSASTDDAASSSDNEHGGDLHQEGTEAGAEASAMEKMMPGLAELSPEDKASAMAQHICPVSEKMLGTMGAPYKVEVEGRQVWLCCPGCEGKLKENPQEYLAKLDHGD